MNFRHVSSFVLASSALLSLAGATSAQELAATGTTVKVPADQIKFVTSGIRQHGGEIFLGRAFGDIQNGKHGTFMNHPRFSQPAPFAHFRLLRRGGQRCHFKPGEG